MEARLLLSLWDVFASVLQSHHQVTDCYQLQWYAKPSSHRTGCSENTSQTLTGKSVRPISSLVGAALSQDPDSDLEWHSYPSSPAQFMEEEGEVSDQDTAMPEQELDQQLSDEQNYWETIRGVRSFIGWHQVQPHLNVTMPLPVLGQSQLVKSLQMTGCVARWRNSTSLSLKATLPVVLKLWWNSLQYFKT